MLAGAPEGGVVPKTLSVRQGFTRTTNPQTTKLDVAEEEIGTVGGRKGDLSANEKKCLPRYRSRFDRRVARFQTPLNRIVNLAAVNRYLSRRFHAESDFVTSNLNDNDLNVVVDDDAFVLFS